MTIDGPAAAPAAPPLAEEERGTPIGLLLVAAPVLLVIGLVIWPIVSAVGRTFWLANPDGTYGFSLRTYDYFFSDDYSLANLRVTLWTTVVTMALLLVVCLPLALYLRFATGRLPAYVQGLAIFPLFVPSVILAYAFIRVLGPNGTVDLLLNAVGLPKIASPYLTPWGPVIGLLWDNIPLTVLILLSGLGGITNAAVEAARDVGAESAPRLLAHHPAASRQFDPGRHVLHGARPVLGLHPPLRARPAVARDDGALHAAHLQRQQRCHRRHHPGGGELRHLHRVRALLRPLRRPQSGKELNWPPPSPSVSASTGPASPLPWG